GHDQHAVILRKFEDWGKIGFQAQMPLWSKSWCCHDRYIYGQDGAAISGLLQDIGDRQCGERTWPVFNIDAPVLAVGEFRRHDAADHIRWATGRTRRHNSQAID